MNLLYDLDTYVGEDVNVVVECTKGSVHKYEYNQNGYMEIVRDLHSKYAYPYNYGFIPRTLAGDGDALDAIVLLSDSISPGTVVRCRVIGIIESVDNGEPDNKVICVPYYIKSGKINIKKILAYLKHYKYPNQNGTQIGYFYPSTTADEIISKCVDRFNEVNK